MRLNVFAILLVASNLAGAAVVFEPPRDFPDLGLALPLMANARGEPLEMPRAEAYLVGSGEDYRLVDRYDTLDLWTSAAVRGRWVDQFGNRLMIARLVNKLPADQPGSVQSRDDYRKALRPLTLKNRTGRDEAVMTLAPVTVLEPEKPRRAERQNFLELLTYPCEAERVLVYAFRPKVEDAAHHPADWYMVSFEIAEAEQLGAAVTAFDKNFLDKVVALKPAPTKSAGPKSAKAPTDDDSPKAIAARENEYLRADVKAAVVNYAEWHCADSGEILVLDNLPPELSVPFATSLTNRLPVLRRAYAAAAPSPLKDPDRPAVVRVFESRQEYLAYVGVDYKWTAAVWSPEHRELVAYYPESGVDGLLETVRHEAFHQYLAYAGAMITASPWFNEGHAEMFAHTKFNLDGELVVESDPRAGALVRSNLAQLAEILPDVMKMGYKEFYDGTAEEREAKYALAWSVAYFLEKGAPKIRFNPWKDLRADYMKALVRTRDMYEATNAVLPEEQMKAFVDDWRSFWRKDQ